MSKKTLEFHYGKHHRAYVDNLNKQVEDTDFERNTLEEVIKISYNNGNPLAPFNNAGQVRLSSSYSHFVVQSLYFLLASEAVSGPIALRILRGSILVLFDPQKLSCWVRDVPTNMVTFLQVWNHDFFWSSLCPGGGGTPEGEVLALIERDFGSYEEFEKEFKQAGATQFGAGWVWLVCKH